MKYVYHGAVKHDENGYHLRVPEILTTFDGNDLFATINKARSYLLKQLFEAGEHNNSCLPDPKVIEDLHPDLMDGETEALIDCDLDSFKREFTTRCVKKNCTLPAWLSLAAEKAGVNFSAVLQDALIDKLHLENEFSEKLHKLINDQYS